MYMVMGGAIEILIKYVFKTQRDLRIKPVHN